jgi:hypothetical protein
MLVNAPTVQLPDSQIGPVKAAYAELDLWKGFLGRYTDPAYPNFYWSFWPATVFSAQAARALVSLFDCDTQFQRLVEHSRIWASEEVFFPTLVHLLGYHLLPHPSRYEYIRYRARYSEADLATAFADANAHWIHPVARQLNDPLRRRISHRVAELRHETLVRSRVRLQTCDVPLAPVIDQMQAVDGWFDESEAELLATACAHILKQVPPPAVVVEVGSYCGRSTVVLGGIMRAIGSRALLYSIDPHEGLVGSSDAGLYSGHPTIEAFRATLAAANMSSFVRIVPARSSEVSWADPIAFLLIDALHDYASVARDFFTFEPFLIAGALVAFHDYALYAPGVKTFVHELLGTGKYEFVDAQESLIILRLADWSQPVSTCVDVPGSSTESWSYIHKKSDRSDRPTVSCIMPTSGRPDFVVRAIEYFLRQRYEPRELIIVDDDDQNVADLVPFDRRIQYGRVRGGTLTVGAKRNLACEQARGDLICHWDDDDWYAPWRLAYQVQALQDQPEVSICGLSDLLFYDTEVNCAWRYTWPGADSWVYGATLCYRKAFWREALFADVSEGEDTLFVRAAPRHSVLSLELSTFYVGLIHSRNTSPKRTGSPGWTLSRREDVRRTLGQDWSHYAPRR